MSVTADRHVILSLGAGAQSTALALMALRGEVPTSCSRPMAAVFADTGFEPRRVYEHLYRLTRMLGTELPVHIVRAMRPDGTPAHIREDTEAIVRGETTRLANPPVFVKESVEYTPFPHPEHQARFEAYLIRRGEIPRFVTMPLFAHSPEPGQPCCAASAHPSTSTVTAGR